MIWKKNHLRENRISAPQTFRKTNFDPKNVMNQCQGTWMRMVIIGTYPVPRYLITKINICENH